MLENIVKGAVAAVLAASFVLIVKAIIVLDMISTHIKG